jgi:hypothetical protein
LMRRSNTFLLKHVSMNLLEVSLMFSEAEVKSPYFLQVWCDLVIPILRWSFMLHADAYITLLVCNSHNLSQSSMCDNENIIKRKWTKTLLLPSRNNNHSLTDRNNNHSLTDRNNNQSLTDRNSNHSLTDW